ncbi:MAG: DMT family transporter, partial [Actinomycetota bacterium]
IGAIAGALLIVVAAAVAGRGLGGLAEVLRQPAWLWVVPGVFGAAIVISLTYAPPRIGTFGTFALVIAGQLAASLLIDGLGLFGVERVPVTATRIAGLALLVAGGVLVLRR